MTNQVSRQLRAFWNEPSIAHEAPHRVWRDWAVVGVMVTITIGETVFRPDVLFRPLALLMALTLALLTLARRSQPLATLLLAFVAVGVVDVSIIVFVETELVFGLYSMAFILIFPYALFRWGAGREAAIGLVVLLAVFSISAVRDSSGVGDIIGGFVILFVPIELGLTVRFWLVSRDRRLEQVRSTEREQLARELHDTVAHHVSAIAIQAQAGQAVASVDPEMAVEALAVIEGEASRTLSEMRHMIGALRQDDEAELVPQRGVADIARLAQPGATPVVDVELAGNVEQLPASVDAALYRLAQESITNAVRHARQAKRIAVRLIGEADYVRLIVEDDGLPVARTTGSHEGYGLVGMSERASLLGGTLEAGPRADRGWSVTAVLPRTTAR